MTASAALLLACLASQVPAADTRPLRAVLVIDVTTRPVLSSDAVNETVEQFLGALGPEGRASIWRVGGGVFPGPPLTRDRRVLGEAARRAVRPQASERSGPSPIWDALVAAADALRREEGRRVLLLVTDGRATGNRYGLADAVARLTAADVSVHVLAPGTVEEFFSDMRLVTVHPDRALEALAAKTGGTLAFYGEERPRAVGTLAGRLLRGEPVERAIAVAPPPPPPPTPEPAAQEPATIRSGVELVRVDVQVTTRAGVPSVDLLAEDFEVRIDGQIRPVRTVQLVRHAETAAPGAATPITAAPAVQPGAPGRTIILAVDQSSFMLTTESAAHEVVRRLASMADPNDMIGLVAYPSPGVAVAPTRDRKALLDAVKQIGGQLQPPRAVASGARIHLSFADAIDWTTDADFRQNLIRRICAPGDLMCPKEVEMAASEIVLTMEMTAMRSLSGLHGVIDAAREYPGRKTLVIVSAGFPAADRMGGRPDVRGEAEMLGRRAAAANVVLYSLHLDVSFLYAFSAAGAGEEVRTFFRNSQILAAGLEQFTASGGGTVISVPVGPDLALKRLLTETSAYYLVGVEPLPEHRDGDVHRIQVRVTERGAVVRARTSVLIPKAETAKGPG